MKVGAVAWQDHASRWHKQLMWGRESPQEFGAALYRLACRYGHEQAAEKRGSGTRVLAAMRY